VTTPEGEKGPASWGLPALVRPSGPFGWLRLAVVAAVGYTVAALVWIGFGDTLPGGRWFAVHLFTLGILSNLVLVFSEHFAETVLHAPTGANRDRRLVLWNVGALVLLGFPPSLRYPFAIGSTLLLGVVLWLIIDLGRARRRGLGGPLAFVVRTYQHAGVAFLVASLIGALLGLGLLPGRWYGAGRFAHLHANVLGWGGLTLLATLVFLAPAMMGTGAQRGAHRRAARALPVAAAGLVVVVVGLLLTGDAQLAAAGRSVAASGLAAYAGAAAVVCGDVIAAYRRVPRTPAGTRIAASSAWFVAAVGIAALAVAAGRWRLLDAAGVTLLVGVLGQAILATLTHLTPVLWGRGEGDRSALTARMHRRAGVVTAALNVGVAAITAAALAGRGAGMAGSVVARVGWVLVAVAVVAILQPVATLAVRRRDLV
jgi:hypothetical protein